MIFFFKPVVFWTKKKLDLELVLLSLLTNLDNSRDQGKASESHKGQTGMRKWPENPAPGNGCALGTLEPFWLWNHYFKCFGERKMF